jgi:hypothetical protein
MALSPEAEEKAFQQAVQCTMCLQFGHSNVECAPAVQTVELVPIQNRGQCDNNRFSSGNHGGRQFQRGDRPPFLSNTGI